jgi:hypothetical protein
MHEIEPIIATTPEELAVVLGLPATAAREWQIQRLSVTPLKEARTQKTAPAKITKRAKATPNTHIGG